MASPTSWGPATSVPTRWLSEPPLLKVVQTRPTQGGLDPPFILLKTMSAGGSRAPEPARAIADAHVFAVGDRVSVCTHDAWGKDWAVMKHGTRVYMHARTEGVVESIDLNRSFCLRVRFPHDQRDEDPDPAQYLLWLAKKDVRVVNILSREPGRPRKATEPNPHPGPPPVPSVRNQLDSLASAAASMRSRPPSGAMSYY